LAITSENEKNSLTAILKIMADIKDKMMLYYYYTIPMKPRKIENKKATILNGGF